MTGHTSSHSLTTELPPRDRRIVQLVARFGQATSSHIQTLLFPGIGRTPVDRALRRLVADGYLIRIERRLVGGARGGSGQYVYALGRRGFYQHFDGRYVPARAVHYHSLAILDCYVVLKKPDQILCIIGLTTEPDCWVRVGSNELKPDLYVELERAGGQRLKLWLEVDMGTEGQKQLRAKLERYWWAYSQASVDEWPEFPGVVWVAIDEEREKELRWIIGQLPEDARALFQVTTLAGLSDLLA